MTDMKYRAWVSWHGGERPVSPDTWVEVYPRQGLDLIGKASRFDWSSTNILRYRLCAPDEYHDPKTDSPNEHYRQGDIECIDAIRAALTDEEWRGYCKGNVLKYTWREKHKGGDGSLLKAQDYLRWALAGKAEDKR